MRVGKKVADVGKDAAIGGRISAARFTDFGLAHVDGFAYRTGAFNGRENVRRIVFVVLVQEFDRSENDVVGKR